MERGTIPRAATTRYLNVEFPTESVRDAKKHETVAHTRENKAGNRKCLREDPGI